MEQKKLELEQSLGFELSDEVADRIEEAGGLHTGTGGFVGARYIDASRRPYNFVKRAVDILAATLGLVLALLPMCAVALAIYVDDPGRVFFSQYRVGRFGRRFRLYKFRTMRMDAPKYRSTQEMATSQEYITRIGHFLRKSSLDELPQLLNVLKGDMSIVGPRPLISDEVEIHELRARLGIYTIRPGITGLAQINGRDTVDAQSKVGYDLEYLKGYGPKMDIRILLATVPTVLEHVGFVDGVVQDAPDSKDR